MKHAGKGFWRGNAPGLARVLACAACALTMVASNSAWALTASRIQSAQMILTSNGSFDMPPLTAAMPTGDAQAVALPHVFPRGINTPENGNDILTAWYQIAVPDAAQPASGRPLRLYLPRWQTVGQIAVYADSRLVFRSGAGPIWNGFNHPLWVALGGAADDAPPETVVIRVDHLRSAGLALSSVWLGDEKQLSQRRWWRDFFQTDLTAILSAAFLLIGFFALGIWLLRREAMYGLFFLVSLFNFTRNLHFHQGLEPLPISEAWYGWMTINSAFWALVTAYIFGFRLYAAKFPLIERALVIMTVMAAIISLPGLTLIPLTWLLTPTLYLGVLVGIVAMTLISIRAAWRARSGEAMLVIAWSLLIIPTALHDLMLQNYRLDIEQLYLMPYTMLGFFPIILYVMLKRYTSALHKAERSNADLQISLKAKEVELGESYARLRVIENEQVLGAERQRLMQDMHDGLGASLMGALKAVESGRPLDLSEILRECIDDLKLAIDSLEPIQSDLLLLLATLRFRLGARLEQAGVSLHWHVEDIPRIEWLNPHSALHVLRIVQEVLANAVKHAQASAVTLATKTRGNHVVVVIEDNGIGFDASAPRARGRGVSNVLRRAQAIGAQASWNSRPGGTQFELALPLQAPQVSQPASY
ncbi:ATP-binding protein [Polaromonas sp. A23]|uniref:sensor histidine kinase n=1 Tax=Polaromonas sp. A23 TaxID=1944133 RepID=UPI00143C83A6|nr:ATP-binding protein [Polaromonas sp. A23]